MNGSPVAFDIDKYVRTSRRVDLSHVNWADAARHPITVEEAQALAYMMDIESHTIVFLRDLLATRAALEPDISAFLACWAYEEFWHGEAFSRFLGEIGHQLPPEHENVAVDDPYPSRIGRNRGNRQKATQFGYGRYLLKLGASVALPDFAAVHMTWGAVNELTTLTAYRIMHDRTAHPTLRIILAAIIKDERRHFSFYRAQARLRLGRSSAARRVTRWAMQHAWKPVGTGVRPVEETDRTVAFIFGHETAAKAIADMDRTISELPGLDNLTICADAVNRAIARLSHSA